MDTEMIETLREPDAPASAADTIILIHGTFAHEALWTRDDSSMAAAIRSRLRSTRLLAFNWSGRNSPKARILAGLELSALGKSLREKGCRRIWLVGHSHGGNVALYSLRDPQMQEMVAGICFLGTPFFRLTPRSVERFSAVFTQTLSWLILFPGWLPYGAMLSVSLAETLFDAVAAGLMLYFGNALVALGYLIFRSRLRRAAHGHLTAVLTRLQRQTLEWLRQPEPDCPTFVASVRWDEAGLLLRTIDTITVAPWHTFALAVRLVAAVTLGFIAGYLAAIVIYGDTVYELGASDPLFVVAFLLPIFVVLAPPIIAIVFGLIRGTPFAFGYEGLLGAAMLRIRPEPLPFWSRRDHSQHFEHLPPPGLRGLRHSSFYTDPKVIQACVDWIAEDRRLSSGTEADAPIIAPAVVHQSRLRRWLPPALIAFIMIVVQIWMVSERIRDAAIPRRDEFPSTADFSFSEPMETIFQIDESVETPERGFFELARPPITINLDIILSPASICLIAGEFTFGNWGSTINVSLHDVQDPRFTLDDFDMEVPNHRKITNDFIQPDIHQEIWEWQSAYGTNISFKRQFANEFSGTLFVRMWNESSTPVHIMGQLRMTCQRGREERNSE